MLGFVVSVVAAIRTLCIIGIHSLRRMRSWGKERNIRLARRAPVSESIALTVRSDNQGNPMCCVRARQLYFLLSRDQVRQFYQLLIEAQRALQQRFPSSRGQEKKEELAIYDIAGQSLHAKIRFVRRSAQLQYPAIMSFESLALELTEDELTVLDMQVGFFVMALNREEANGFYATPQFSVKSMRHLIYKDQHALGRPVLCGSLPPPSGSKILQGWFFIPFPGQPEEKNLCPVCWERWQTEQQTRQELPALGAMGKQSALISAYQGNEVWYEV